VTTNRGTLRITLAELTVTASNVSRPYRSANPRLPVWVAPNRDDISATNWTAADLTSSPGPYDIVPLLKDPHNRLTNYTVTTNRGTLTITPAELTVTASNVSRAFGTANPPLPVWITPNPDDISATNWTVADLGSPPGRYDIVPRLRDPHNKRSNYAVTTIKGTLIVTPAGARQPDITNLFGITNLDFVWIDRLGTNTSGLYVAVNELSSQQYTNLLGRLGRPVRGLAEDINQPASFGQFDEAKSLVAALNGVPSLRLSNLRSGHWRLPALDEYKALAQKVEQVVVPPDWIMGDTNVVKQLQDNGENLAYWLTASPRAIGLGKKTYKLSDLIGNVREWTAEGTPFGIRPSASVRARDSMRLNRPRLPGEDVGVRLVWE
jgi:hypothetical protein